MEERGLRIAARISYTDSSGERSLDPKSKEGEKSQRGNNSNKNK